MAEIPSLLLVHTVQVKSYEGVNSLGQKTYANPVEVHCFRDEKVQVIQNPVGEEVAVNITLYTQPDVVIKDEDLISPYATDNFTARVVTTTHRTDGGLGAWQHREVFCEGFNHADL